MPTIYVQDEFGCPVPVAAATVLAGLVSAAPEMAWVGVPGPGIAITAGGVHGHAPTIGIDPTTLPQAAASALPATLVGGDGLLYPLAMVQPQAVFGVSPLVINPTTGNAVWTLGQTESTPLTSLVLTNPHPCRSLLVELKVFHLFYVRDPNLEAVKQVALAGQSLISVDDGSGVLQSLGSYPNSFGNTQLSAIVVRSDPGQNNNSGNQVSMTGLLYVTMPPGETRTFQAQSTLTVMDSGFGNLLDGDAVGRAGAGQ